MDAPQGSADFKESDELQRLRQRAYGPDADIAGDVAAQARLSELEATQRRERAPVVDAAAALRTPGWEPVPTPDEPLEGSRRASTTALQPVDGAFAEHQPYGGSVTEESPAGVPVGGALSGPWRRRRLLLWGPAAVAVLAATIGIGVFVDESNQSQPEADTIAPFPQVGDIDAGTYLVTSYPVPFEITVPGGWETFDGASLGKDDPALPNSWNVAVFFYPITYVPTDACAWKGSLVQIDPTAEAFVDAMAAQASTVSTPAVEVMVGDYSGFEFDHAAESGADIPDCDLGRLCVYSDFPQECNGSTYGTGGERETYRAIDLNGERAVIGLGQPDESIHPALAKEARELFDSIEFVGPDE